MQDAPQPPDGSNDEPVVAFPHGNVEGGLSGRVPKAYMSSTLSTAPLMATTDVPAGSLFPMHGWNPRKGRGLDFHKWHSSLKRLVAAFGLTLAEFRAGPPSVPSLQGAGRLTKQAQLRAVAERDEAIAQYERWQAIDTAIHWHLRPSIIIDEADFVKDTRYLDTLYEGSVAAGGQLLEWALGFVDMSSNTQQIKLLRGLAAAVVPAGSDQSAINAVTQRMFQVWSLLAGSEPANPDSLTELYDFVLHALPTG